MYCISLTTTHAKAMTSGGWVDQVDQVQARQVSGSNDVRHAWTFSGVGYLPFGRDRLLFSHASRWVDEIINGWEISPDYNYYSGFAWLLGSNGGPGSEYWETASGGPITKSMAVPHTFLQDATGSISGRTSGFMADKGSSWLLLSTRFLSLCGPVLFFR